jgi:hypothetical protein
VADPTPEADAQPNTTGLDNSQGHRAKPGWRGWLTGSLMGLAGGMAVSDISTTVGYRGLTGVVAAAGVLTATTWIRKLDARAWLPRYAPWLFLIPAAAVAVVAAFNPESGAGILTAVAVVLTGGAVLLAAGFDAASRLLGGAALIGFGVALVGIVMANLANLQAPSGAGIGFAIASIGFGVAVVVFGVAMLANRRALFGAAGIGCGVAVVAAGVALLADRRALGAY